MDKEKEGTSILDTITEGVSSAATSIAEVVTGTKAKRTWP
jgi:hypothetical protein